MDSKKLGMIAAAALTVLAAQAHADNTKKGAKAAGDKVCANGCGTADHSCAGYTEMSDHKTPEACAAAKGKWMSKAEVLKNQASLKNKKGEAHGHDHKH
jgi:hypothetical protein